MAQTDNRDAKMDEELELWRQAAQDALEQLDWAIGYLDGLSKHHEARALSANRRVIRRRVLELPAEPLPGDPASAASAAT